MSINAPNNNSVQNNLNFPINKNGQLSNLNGNINNNSSVNKYTSLINTGITNLNNNLAKHPSLSK